MSLVEHEQNFVIVSEPVNTHGEISLQSLRDLVEATDAMPETTVAVFVNGELRVEISR